MSIRILVPSRGRPQRAAEMVASVKATAAGLAKVVVYVDDDDATQPEYVLRLGQHVLTGPRLGYTRTLNILAEMYWDHDTILGAFGDDVLFRSEGWDEVVERTLATPGLAYGNDLIHGENHPSAVFMSSIIARHLGWLAMPGTSHQWADDAWKTLGQRTKTLRYMPDVVVEHMHPGVGKADWDDTYRSVFEDARAKADFEGFETWKKTWLEADAANVWNALNEAVGLKSKYPVRVE